MQISMENKLKYTEWHLTMAFINTVLSQKSKLKRNEAELPVCFLMQMQLYFKNVHGICNQFMYMENYMTTFGIVELYRKKITKTQIVKFAKQSARVYEKQVLLDKPELFLLQGDLLCYVLIYGCKNK